MGLKDHLGRHQFITPWRPNLVLFEWAPIVARRLVLDEPDYILRGMFIEFENVTLPGDPVSAPTFDRTGGLSYYNGLVSDPDRDYLRVPALPFPIDSTDETTFPKGNRITLTGQTAGGVGVHGKTFSDTVNSKVFGAALVGFKADGDASQDLVFSRFYFSVADQQIKLPTSDISITWGVEFL
jgi:hypothetical protein